ncbi:MAG: carboxypeptidase regulatory-like domain-containing protein [Planctomycetes bacterium]|nr:carboxypeptidase regulatory-like domain-containing protein [Planctomycetota bacterium]
MGEMRGSARAATVMAAVLLMVALAGAFLVWGGGSADPRAENEAAALGKAAAQDGGPEGVADAQQGDGAERAASEPAGLPAEEPAEEAAAGGIPPDATGLSGRVIGKDGKPAAGVEVVVRRHVEPKEAAKFGVQVEPGEEYARYERGGETDQEGRFVIIDLVASPQFEIKVQSKEGLLGRRDDVEVFEKLVFDVGDVPLRRGALVSGQVRTDGGLPLSGAEVAFGWRWSEKPILTGAEGRFPEEVLFPGRHGITVKAKGYALPEPVTREFVEGDRVDDLELVVIPAALISGRVVDEAGRGIAGARLGVSRTQEGGAWEWYGEQQTSDQDGRFRFDSICPGKYQIWASARGYRQEWVGEVEAGGAPLEITMGRSCQVQGMVVNSRDGAPVEAESLNLLWIPPWDEDEQEARFERYWEDTETDMKVDGTFSLAFSVNSEGGRFKIEAHAKGFAPGESTEFRLAGESSGMSGILVRVDPGLGLTVKVLDAEKREPVAGAIVNVHRAAPPDSSQEPAPVRIGPGGRIEAWPEALGEWIERIVSDQAGLARCATLAAGSFALAAEKKGYARAIAGGVEVRPGVEPEPVEMLLTKGGAIEGRVVNNRNVPEPALEVDARGPNGSGKAVSLENGSYRIEGLPAGRYSVQARLEDGSRSGMPFSSDRRRGDSREIPEAERFPVLVEDGQTAQHDVTVERIDPGSLAGVVLFNGCPAARVSVVVNVVDDSGRQRRYRWGENVKTDALGRFRFRRLAPANYALVVMKTWSIAFEGGQVRVNSNIESQVTVEVGIGSISGRILDAKQQPIAAADVSVNRGQGAVASFGWGQSAESDADGRYVLENLQAGAFDLTVRVKGFVTQTVNSIRVAAQRATGPLDVVMQSGGWVKVRLEGASREVLSDTWVILRFTGDDGREETSWEWPGEEEWMWMEVGTAASGTLSVNQAVDGGQSALSGSARVAMKEGESAEVTIRMQ